MKLYFYVTAIALSKAVGGFLAPLSKLNFHNVKPQSQLLLSESPMETESGVSDLIYTLLDGIEYRNNDEARRQRLRDVFQEKHAEQSQQFFTIFQASLTRIGDEVQQQAREAARLKEEDEISIPSPSPSEKSSPIPIPREEDRRLWAMVDMLVQSKTIVKQMSQNSQ